MARFLRRGTTLLAVCMLFLTVYLIHVPLLLISQGARRVDRKKLLEKLEVVNYTQSQHSSQTEGVVTNEAIRYELTIDENYVMKNTHLAIILKSKGMEKLTRETGAYLKLLEAAKKAGIKEIWDGKELGGIRHRTLAASSLDSGRGIRKIGYYFDTLTMDIVNPYPFNYIINNASLCKGTEKKLTYLIYLHSAPRNAKRREAIRNTWGRVNLFEQFPSRIVFFLAAVEGKDKQKIQAEVMQESKQHGDIVQLDFVDAYKNLTFKAMGAMRWINDFCPHAKYIFKSDDDTFVDMPLLLHRLTTEFAGSRRFIMGLFWKYPSLHIQRPGKLCSRWCIPFSVLAGLDHYPAYMSGSFYVMSGDLPAEIFDMATRTPFFWVDDAYLTGLVAARIGGLQHIDISASYKFNLKTFKEYMDKIPFKLMVTLTKDPVALWKLHLPKMAKKGVAVLGEKRYKDLVMEAEAL